MTASTDQERVSLPLDLVNDLLALCTPEDHELRERVKQAARRTQVVPKGWKLVPEEPTPAMYDRVMREGYYHDDPKAVKAVLRAEYQDMLAAAPQPPACNPSMQPELATEAAAEHKALRSVYEAARGLLRYEGVDDGRAITYRTKLASAIEEVKHIDSGLWEPPEAAPVQMPPLPWQYRPDKYDDWGCIKDADGRVICYARDTTVLDEATLTKHRAAGTDPWREVAMFIANACNAAMAKRAALSAGPGIQKAVQALIDAAILEGGSPPPSQEAAMQATEQRKADLLKLLEPFIGTPLNE